MKIFPKSTDFIDIHSHNPKQEAGVFFIFNVFSSDAKDLPSDLPVSIGLHPWHLDEASEIELPEILKKCSGKSNFMAVGETGLDRVIKIPIENQFSAFRTQIEFADKSKKPLIIHCVKAFPELLSLRKEYGKKSVWIIHGFNANESVAAECVNAGIYISFSQRLISNHEKAQKIARVVPITMVFAETDDDTMTIQEVYQNIADSYGLTVKEVKKIIFENFARIS